MPRLRTRSTGALGPAITQSRWGNDKLSPNPSYTVVSNPESLGWKKTITDISTPDFRAWLARGGIVNNPVWIEERTFTGSDKGWAFEAQVPGNRYFGDSPSNWCIRAYGVPRPWVDVNPAIDQMVASTATQAWAGVNVGDVQGLAALGELHQTLNLLGDPVRTLQDFLWKKAWANADWKAARGAIAKRKALLSLLSSLWLQYQYAFRPAIMEIEGVLKELGTQTFNTRRTSRGSDSRVITASRAYTSGYGGIDVDFTETQVTELSVRSGVLYDAVVDPIKQFGLHWTNLPSALWELTPWSFVADWFTNVGDYLQAIAPKIGVNTLAEFHTVEVKTTIKRKSGAARVTSGNNWVTKRSPDGEDVAVYQSRTRRNFLPSPSLVLDTRLIDVMSRGNRGVNAYMLFVQQFIKGR